MFATELNKGSYQERHIHAYQLSGILYLKQCEDKLIKEKVKGSIYSDVLANSGTQVVYQKLNHKYQSTQR